MGFEVRRVARDWIHPRARGEFIPLLAWPDGVDDLVADWHHERRQWERGEHPAQLEGWGGAIEDFADFAPMPDPAVYMPYWPAEARTHFQMYETTTEGTPVSPVFESPESLARWLALAGQTACETLKGTYEEWLLVCRGAFAPSMVASQGRDGRTTFQNGVAGLAAPAINVNTGR